MYTSFHVTAEDGLSDLQHSLIDLEKATTVQRDYSPHIVHGLLQTSAYARAILSTVIALLQIRDDTDATVAKRLARQRVLDAPGKQFRLLMGEEALLRTVGSAEIMAEQIGVLLDILTARDNVEIGIVPVSAPFVSTAGGFILSDDRYLDVETVTGLVRVTDEPDIATAARHFDAIAAVAAYGHDARVILQRAQATHARLRHDLP
ncbi:DUF5753 domain-containing protein [Nocardia veterana]|uniref:DUF5753 domain-containing protein n=1 Tax=Nocardia veterana TaxID=132249 RepID=A0A7X6LZL4_9NOCA|nr:DUF5753 domain-containing protein [Nocardia veterana]NKY87549.1 hypothetical protein [Nocardia veterana]